jgi:DNA-binding response OmpR family regulator
VIDVPLTTRLSALVADPTDDAVGIVTALTYAGFTVTLTDNFEAARRLLEDLRPLVLVTEIRLGAYNGIHLALRCRMSPSRVTVVVTSGFADPVLEREVEALDATFIAKPFIPVDLVAAVYRTALRQPSIDGRFEPVRAPFERRLADRRTTTTLIADRDRRHSDRRGDIAGLMIRASLS